MSSPIVLPPCNSAQECATLLAGFATLNVRDCERVPDARTHLLARCDRALRREPSSSRGPLFLREEPTDETVTWLMVHDQLDRAIQMANGMGLPTTLLASPLALDAETLVTSWAAYCWLQGWHHCGVAVTVPHPMRGMAYAYLVLDKDVPEPMRSRCHESPHLPAGTIAFDPCQDASGRAPDASLYGAEQTAYAWLPNGVPEST